MEQLLLHGIGDYIIQTGWMASEKTKRWWPAVVHGITYTALFALLTTSWIALAVIGLTHVVIDRYRLAKHVVWFKESVFGSNKMPLKDFRRLRELPNVPDYQYFWLVIIIDNIMHLGINYLAIEYL
ncbi:MAG: DUF3307 domain-containing protein [Patescibacteria group bacterium]